MSEIKVGEYIRTKDGRIEKVKEINKYGVVTKHDNNDDTFSTEVNWYAESGREINKENILEHSFKIIDLIENKDVIKYFSNNLGGETIAEVIYSCPLNEDYKWGLGYVETSLDNHIIIDDIKRFVTKEQFKEMEYKL